nr:hypothetical protein [Tanacetum cinerariifolium]
MAAKYADIQSLCFGQNCYSSVYLLQLSCRCHYQRWIRRSSDFTSNDVFDEAAYGDGTVQLPKDFPVPGTPPSFELPSLKDARKTVVNGEIKTISAKSLEGTGGDDDVAFHFKY